jgi:hypothetical protein
MDGVLSPVFTPSNRNENDTRIESDDVVDMVIPPKVARCACGQSDNRRMSGFGRDVVVRAEAKLSAGEHHAGDAHHSAAKRDVVLYMYINQ